MLLKLGCIVLVFAGHFAVAQKSDPKIKIVPPEEILQRQTQISTSINSISERLDSSGRAPTKSINENSFQSTLEFDADVPENLRNLVISDLSYLYSIRGNGATPLHLKLFGSVDGAAYKRYFEARISRVKIGDCGATQTALACMISDFGADIMFINPRYTPGIEPRMARIAMYFNVARHSDTSNDYWPVVTCPNPFKDEFGKDIYSRYNGQSMAGAPACDLSPYGAYGSTAVLLKNIEKFCTSCSSAARDDASKLVPYFLQRVIQTDAQQMILHDGR